MQCNRLEAAQVGTPVGMAFRRAPRGCISRLIFAEVPGLYKLEVQVATPWVLAGLGSLPGFSGVRLGVWRSAEVRGRADASGVKAGCGVGGESNEVADDAVGADHGAGGEGLAGGVGVEAIGHEAVLLRVDEVQEGEPEGFERVRVEVAFEDGVLNAYAVVLAGFGDAGEAFGVGDVVGEHDEHTVLCGRFVGVGCSGEGFVPPGVHGAGSVDEEGFEGVGVFECGFEHDGLLFELLSDGGAVADGFAEELAFHAALVLEEEFSAAVGVEEAAAVAGFEVAVVEDAMGKEVEGEGFDQGGAEGFDQVECQGPAAVVGRMEGAEGGVEAVCVAEGGGFAVEEGGGEGDTGVDGVEWGSGGAAFEGEIVGQEGGPGLVVAGGGQAFKATEFVEGAGLAYGGEQSLEPVDGLAGEGGFGVGGLLLGSAGLKALQHAALVVELGGHDAPCDLQGEGGVQSALVLADSGLAGGLEGREEAAQVTALPGEDLYGDAAAEEFGQGGGGEMDVLACDDAFEVV